ncbi:MULTISPECIES: ester cyclase [unclassified Nocardia]|uniref:ester cyclase n=1 Tax=unclassified Nocardia TaxID=2637762 RepID=UPI001CE47A7D|nr:MULTISPECIES: ester cyclase [unclassified Nocardia]
MTPEDLKERNRRFVDEAWVQGDLAVVDTLFGADIVHHVAGPRPAPGPQGVKDFITGLRSVFADMHVTYENEVVEGDKAVQHITVAGIHAGEFLGIAPTGRRVAFEVVDINRFDRDGRIVEQWSIADLFSVLRQIGAPTDPGHE